MEEVSQNGGELLELSPLHPQLSWPTNYIKKMKGVLSENKQLSSSCQD